jgi:hypothetical protein
MANSQEWERGYEAGWNGASHHANPEPKGKRFSWERGRRAGKAANNRYWACREKKEKEVAELMAAYNGEKRCVAPVPGGCPRPAVKGTLCFAHAKRKSRGADMERPIRKVPARA